MTFAVALWTCQPFTTSTIVMFLRFTVGSSLMRNALIRIVVIVYVIQSSMLISKILHTIRYGSNSKVYRRKISTSDLFRFESESLHPLSSWIALTDRVCLCGVGVEADVARCQNLLDPLALRNCRFSMR